MKQPIYNTALYLRLSHDDEQQGESVSIQTQRTMLQTYARDHHLHVVGEYVDDGWSGTNYDRPAFQRMIDDIEDGKINCVVTKDLSRLGRNYILTGQYTEIYFPSKGVRYIAVNDNVDTLNGESELAPFLNILNEMHARQTSKKVKAAMHTRRMNGAHWGPHMPLGYMRDPDRKGHLLVDPETKWIVEKIFDLASHGMGAAKITRVLVEEKVPTPGWLHYSREGTYARFYEGEPEEKRFAWNITAVKKILKDENYKSSETKNKLEIDPETRWIVEKIYNLALHGAGPFKITQTLTAEKVPTASWINFQRNGGFAHIYADAPEEKRYAWTIAQVKGILTDELYIGNSVHCRKVNNSYKEKSRRRKDRDEWTTIPDTHEAIISKDDFAKVQELIAHRRRSRKEGTPQIFAGLVYCSDCGWSMSYGVNKSVKNPFNYYSCIKYKQYKGACTSHYIRYDVLYPYVLSRLQYWTKLAQEDEDALLRRLLKAEEKEQVKAGKSVKATLKRRTPATRGSGWN